MPESLKKIQNIIQEQYMQDTENENIVDNISLSSVSFSFNFPEDSSNFSNKLTLHFYQLSINATDKHFWNNKANHSSSTTCHS